MEKKKIAFVGTDVALLDPLLAPYKDSFELVEKEPDYVFVFGGDGTLMHAEHEFPSVPKLFLRNSRIAKLAGPHTNEEILKAFFENSYDTVEHMKLEVEVRGKKAVALNDIVMHNANPRHAIRYKVTVDGKVRYEHVIGDGIVCATPLGSTGYYRSITDSSIEVGIGLAFNNSTEQTDHIVLKDSSKIEIEILRGPGFCYVDNQENSFELTEGDVLTVQKASDRAYIIRIHS